MTAATLRVRLGRLMAIVAAAVIAYLTLTPSSSTPLTERFCLVCGPLGGVDALLNLALFLPLGVGLGLAGVSRWRALVLLWCGTLTIEVLQMELVPGRDASLGDLVMNGTGGLLGYYIGARIEALVFPRPRVAGALLLAWTVLWGGVQLASGFAALPRATDSQYFGQLAEPYGPALVRFRGDVVDASIVDAQAIPNGRVADSRTLRRTLMRPVLAIRATVVEEVRADGYAPIVRIVDAAQRELVVLAQDGSGLIFGTRGGADVLRLRPLRYRLPHVFPAPGNGDTVVIQAERSPGHVRLRASGPGTDIDAIIPHEMSGAWRLIFPRRAYAGPGILGLLVSSAWTVALMVPAAYFLVFAVPGTHPRGQRARLAGTHLVLLATAMFGVSRHFGITVYAWEWLAMLGGYALGLAFAALGMRHRRSTLQA